ncbi:Transposase, Mutator family [Paenibacillus sp. S02]|nr:Transposase, Mutator family [Paenibacillus sp. S02]
METHLGYEKHDVKAKETPNSRNGKSKKTVVSEYGEQEISVPRDRLGEFEPLVVKKLIVQRSDSEAHSVSGEDRFTATIDSLSPHDLIRTCSTSTSFIRIP